MKRVYVAGSYSADNVIQVLENMRIGMRAGTKLLLNGISPFVPWFDYQFQLMLQDNEKLNVKDYYDYSMSWLEASDAVFVLPNWEKSKGTQAEIARAVELGIPVFYHASDVLEWDKKPHSMKSRFNKSAFELLQMKFSIGCDLPFFNGISFQPVAIEWSSSFKEYIYYMGDHNPGQDAVVGFRESILEIDNSDRKPW